MEPPTPKYVSY